VTVAVTRGKFATRTVPRTSLAPEAKPGKPEAERGARLSLVKRAMVELVKRAVAELGKRAVAELGKRAMAELVKRAVEELGKRTVAELGKRTVAELGKRAMAELGKRAVAELVKRAMAELVKRAMAELGKRAVAELGKRAMAELVKRAMAELVKRAMAELVKRAMAELGKVAVAWRVSRLSVGMEPGRAPRSVMASIWEGRAARMCLVWKRRGSSLARRPVCWTALGVRRRLSAATGCATGEIASARARRIAVIQNAIPVFLATAPML
jgi:histone H3/H4